MIKPQGKYHPPQKKKTLQTQMSVKPLKAMYMVYNILLNKFVLFENVNNK